MPLTDEQQRWAHLTSMYNRIQWAAHTEQDAWEKARAASKDLRPEKANLWQEGAAWQRKQYREEYFSNPVLNDAIEYYMERQALNNPKGWAHVLRATRSADEHNAWPDTTPEGIAAAIEVLEFWARLDMEAKS